MLAGQPVNDELEASHVRLDLQARREPAMNCASATGSWGNQQESLERIDQTTTPTASSARSHEIKIDQSHRVLASTGSRDRQGGRVWLILGTLVASSGLAWIVISALALPFSLTWVGGWGGYRFFNPNAVSWIHPVQDLNSSARISDSNKEDRLQNRGTIIRETDRKVPPKVPDSPNLFSSTEMIRWKPSPGAVPSAPSASKYSTAAPQHTASVEARAAKPYTQARLTPTPETRPTTIEGWTLREVVNGTAVLEGPGGIWKVRRGDTVPGVGRIVAIFRWGNRLMVATTKGLISTP